MSLYCIVKKGGKPGVELNSNRANTFLEWLKSPDRHETEVIEVSLAGTFIRRFPQSESERIASRSQRPKVGRFA
jgi:hypothetical protein